MSAYNNGKTRRECEGDPFASMHYVAPLSESERIGRSNAQIYSNVDLEPSRGRNERSKSPRRGTVGSRLKNLPDGERQTASKEPQEPEPCDLTITEEKHEVLVDKYSGNNQESRDEARRWIQECRHRHGFYPMWVALKNTRNRSGGAREKRGVEKVKCMKCMHSFKTVQDASIHIVSHHMRLKGFRCDYCEAAYARQDDLKRHIKNSERCSSMKDRSKVVERQRKEAWAPPRVSLGQSDLRLPINYFDYSTSGAERRISHAAIASGSSMFSSSLPEHPLSYSSHLPEHKAAAQSFSDYFPNALYLHGSGALPLCPF